MKIDWLDANRWHWRAARMGKAAMGEDYAYRLPADGWGASRQDFLIAATEFFLRVDDNLVRDIIHADVRDLAILQYASDMRNTRRPEKCPNDAGVKTRLLWIVRAH